jgi:hypothetical protein
MNCDAEWCYDLADVPPLKGPIMPVKAGIIIPDWDRLAKAFHDAGWRWCREVGEPIPINESFAEWTRSGWPPSAERLAREAQQALDRLSDPNGWENAKPGNYVQYGGMIIFKSLSGKPGMALEWLLVEHWGRVKGAFKDGMLEVQS